VKSLFPAIWICCFVAFSLQAGDFIWVDEYRNIRGFTGVDKLGNIYSIDNGILARTSPDGSRLTYGKRAFGPVTFADVSDPLNIIVFFGNFGHVVMLDRNLAEKRSFSATDLMSADIAEVICHSSENGFWAYFPGVFQLVRFNDRGQPEITSPNLSLDHPQMGRVKYLFESEGRLFMAADQIMVFDRHTNFLFLIPDANVSALQVIEQNILYLRDSHLVVYDFFLQRENVFLLPELGVRSFFVKDDKLFLQTEVSLKKFRFTEKFR
jgi:hypothetical protein